MIFGTTLYNILDTLKNKIPEISPLSRLNAESVFNTHFPNKGEQEIADYVIAKFYASKVPNVPNVPNAPNVPDAYIVIWLNDPHTDEYFSIVKSITDGIIKDNKIKLASNKDYVEITSS